MSDLLDAVWNDTAAVTIHYKLHDVDFIHCVQLDPDTYFDPVKEDTSRTSRYIHANEYLSIPCAWLEWTRLEERTGAGKILRSVVTKFWDDGEAWICQIRIYRPYTPHAEA